MQQLEKRTNTEGLVRFLQGSRESRRMREERKSRTQAVLRVSSASRYHLGDGGRGGGGGRRERERERQGGMLGRARGQSLVRPREESNRYRAPERRRFRSPDAARRTLGKIQNHEPDHLLRGKSDSHLSK